VVDSLDTTKMEPSNALYISHVTGELNGANPRLTNFRTPHSLDIASLIPDPNNKKVQVLTNHGSFVIVPETYTV
jgi:hypothetical protein